ncbi:MAG: SH3 domain-containing protein [Clostridium sp.]
MNFKKIIALTLITSSLTGIGISLNANAQTVVNNEGIKTEETSVKPKLAGVFTVTAKSGANIRAGAGTNYKIVATARYGAELGYCGQSKYGTDGKLWHKVESENGKTTGWISETTGWLG